MVVEAKWQTDLRDLRTKLRRLDENPPSGPPPVDNEPDDSAERLRLVQKVRRRARAMAFDEGDTKH